MTRTWEVEVKSDDGLWLGSGPHMPSMVLAVLHPDSCHAHIRALDNISPYAQ
jgi:hypothetical protein